MNREDPLKLTSEAKCYLKTYKTIAEALGIRVYVDKTNGHPTSNKNNPETKSMYHFGKPRGIIIYLLRIKDMRQLAECSIHELVHHAQFLRGMYPHFFQSNGGKSQIRIEAHARRMTSQVLRALFGIPGHRMSREAIEGYSK